MKKGEFVISHDQEYPTITCSGCKREFILVNVLRSDKKGDAAVDQQECDYCPYCGRDMYLEDKKRQERQLEAERREEGGGG